MINIGSSVLKLKKMPYFDFIISFVYRFRDTSIALDPVFLCKYEPAKVTTLLDGKRIANADNILM